MGLENTPTTPRTAGEMVALARAFLTRKGVESARLESELLVGHALSLTRLKLFMELDRPITPEEIDRARDLLVRRGKREPCAYILGEREFFGRPFKVGPGVLVPRPETEHIVDRARDWVREKKARGESVTRAADFGTGSGILAVTLALELDGVDVLAIDVSAKALEFARENARALSADRVQFVEGDGFDVLAKAVAGEGGRFDLVVCNPPYIARSDRAALAPEVAEHEPELALFAPANDPDHFARRFLVERERYVKSGGSILIELGHDQAPRVRPIAAGVGAQIRVLKDYSGHERVLEISV
ncbi:MAG: peptide chain release factor N(5)-glutamine methyltransferase [Planctomycetota bacterium]|nr:peptide chain release factor N(5)-glutamine methyltransferase [Planctomycetota bacterium]